MGVKSDRDSLTWEDFQRLAHLKEGPPDNMHDKLAWYWRFFASDKDAGMTMDEFHMGSLVENPGKTREESKKEFAMLDKDQNDSLSKKEFNSIP